MKNWYVAMSTNATQGHIQRPPNNTGSYSHYTEETTGRNGNLTLPTCRLEVLKTRGDLSYFKILLRGFSQVSNKWSLPLLSSQLSLAIGRKSPICFCLESSPSLLTPKHNGPIKCFSPSHMNIDYTDPALCVASRNPEELSPLFFVFFVHPFSFFVWFH